MAEKDDAEGKTIAVPEVGGDDSSSEEDFKVVKKPVKKKRVIEESESEDEKGGEEEDDVRSVAVEKEREDEKDAEEEDGMSENEREERAYAETMRRAAEMDDGDGFAPQFMARSGVEDALEDKKPVTKTHVDAITLSRSRDLAPHCHLYFFEQLVKGSFVRAVATSTRPPKYALFEVIDCIPAGVNPENGAALTYHVNKVITDWLLICKTGTHERQIKLSAISDEKCTESEYVSYIKRMEKHNLPIMSRERASEKRAHVWKMYSDYYSNPLTDDQVEAIVKTRERLRGNASVNLIKNKMLVQAELETMAAQEIQEEEEEGKGGVADVAALIKEAEEQALKKKHLMMQLEETEQKLQSVLNGQNSALGTLALLTHRNAEGNKGRMEAEDPIDAIVFGRKQGRSGKSYWSVNEAGFESKQQEIDEFWSTKQEKEQKERDVIRKRRRDELSIGTKPIKDLDTFIRSTVAKEPTPRKPDAETTAKRPKK